MSDHSWVHMQIVLNIALRLLRLLVKAGVEPAMVTDHGMTRPRRRGGRRRRRAAARRRHVDPPRRPRGLQPLPRRGAAAAAARRRLQRARADGRDRRDPARDHRPPPPRRALHASRPGWSASPTRSTWRRAARGCRSRRARRGSTRSRPRRSTRSGSRPARSAPVRIEIELNNSAGIFQVDDLLATKIRGTPLEGHVEVVAEVEGETEKRLLPGFRLSGVSRRSPGGQTPAPSPPRPSPAAKRAAPSTPTPLSRAADLGLAARGPPRAAARCPRARRGGRRASSPGGTPPGPRPSPAPAPGACPAATTSVSSPIASASSASTIRPVRIMSSARPMPTIRGRRWVPPSISGTPQRRSGKPSFARLGADPQVAPERQLEAAGQAQPEIAAIVGFDGVSRVKPSGPSRPRLQPLLGDPLVVHRRRDRLQVGAGAEGLVAGAGEDQDPRLVVGLELAIGLEQLVGGVRVDRVPALGAIDGEHRRRRPAARR